MNKHFPESKQYGDIKETDWTQAEAVDLVTGGFPCQPFSSAGKRGGTEDDRYLWPEMYRSIKEVKPRWIVAENVDGILSWNEGLVLDTVLSDLENEGYQVQTYVLPASGVNAPHRRYRVWIVAHSDKNGGCAMQDEVNAAKAGKQAQSGFGKCLQNGAASDSESERINREFGNNNGSEKKDGKRINKPNCIRQGWAASNTKGIRQDLSGRARTRGKRFKNGSSSTNGFWDGFPSQSPVCAGNDGVSDGLDPYTFSEWRKEAIKALGNAICPQVAYQIFKAIKQYETQMELI